MMFDDRPDAAKRLEQARINRGFKTPMDAARAFGWSYPTYFQHEQGIRGIVRASAKYAKAFNVSEGWLLTGEGTPPATAQRDDVRLTSKPIGYIQVRGKVAANTWLDVEEMDFGLSDMELVPSVAGFPAEKQFAVVVDGNCLNKIAAHGSILVCVTTATEGMDVSENDLVVVERRRFGGQMVQRTAKRVRQTTLGFELWPESTDPDHQEPIKLYGDHDGEEIEIIGKVLWILRKP